MNTKPSKLHVLSHHRLASSFSRYIKLWQAVCLGEMWFSSSFQLAHHFIIKKKSKLRIGSGCQALLSRAGYRVRGSPWFWRLRCVCCLLSVPHAEELNHVQPAVDDGAVLLTRMLLKIFLPSEHLKSHTWLSIPPDPAHGTQNIPASSQCTGLHSPRLYAPVCHACSMVKRCAAFGERLGGNFKHFQCLSGDW